VILRKFLAVKANLDSRGIAFANLNYITPLLEELIEQKQITVASGNELLGHKNSNTNSIMKLLEHIQLLRKEKGSGKTFYRLTPKALEFYQKNKKNDLIGPIKPLFLDWLPLRIFVKYLQESPRCKIEEVKEILGEQIKRHTAEIAELIPEMGIKKGYLKPFNEMIITNVLVKISQFLGLLVTEKRRGPYTLTDEGREIAEKIDLNKYEAVFRSSRLDLFKLAILDFLEEKPSEISISSNDLNDEINNFIIFIKKSNYLKTDTKFQFLNKNKDEILTDQLYIKIINEDYFSLNYKLKSEINLE